MISEAEQLSNDTDTLLTWLDAQFNGRVQAWVRSEEQRVVQTNIWAKAIRTMTTEQRHRACALTKQAAARGDAPPTAQQFRRYGLGESAHQAFPALSAPEITPEQRQANIDRISREIKKPRFMRRTLYRKGYDRSAHEEACRAMRAAGHPRYRADMQAMAKNGWTESLEQEHRLAWAQLPGHRMIGAGRMALYAEQDAPPDWILRASHEQAADIDQWIETGELPEWAAKAAAA